MTVGSWARSRRCSPCSAFESTSRPVQVIPYLADTYLMGKVGGRMSRIRTRSVSATMVVLAAVGLSIVRDDGHGICVGIDKGHAHSGVRLARGQHELARFVGLQQRVELHPDGPDWLEQLLLAWRGRVRASRPASRLAPTTTSSPCPSSRADPPAWTLDGTTVSSSPSDKKCSSDPVPIIPGTNGASLVLPIGFVALGILAVGFCCWRYDVNLIPGLRRSIARRPPPD